MFARGSIFIWLLLKRDALIPGRKISGPNLILYSANADIKYGSTFADEPLTPLIAELCTCIKTHVLNFHNKSAVIIGFM